MAHHHRRQRISQENRERLVRAFDEPEQDYLSLADTLGINRSTARGIVRRYLEEGRVNERARGGRNHVKVDEEMRRCIAAILDENPVLILCLCYLYLLSLLKENCTLKSSLSYLKEHLK